MSESGTVALFSATEHGHLVPYLAAIHGSCITHDRTIATFLPPLSHDKLLSWWKERIAETNCHNRIIFLLLNESEPGSRVKGHEVMGVVMLALPHSETGPFRGFVEKLLIHKSFRGRGGARTLMHALEIEAAGRGRTMLVSKVKRLLSLPGKEKRGIISIQLLTRDFLLTINSFLIQKLEATQRSYSGNSAMSS